MNFFVNFLIYMKYLLILFILSPCVAIAQDFDYWGARMGYTHTNRSHNLIFAGASLNTRPDLGGISLYGGTHIGFHSDMPSKVQIIPEVGAEFCVLLLGGGFAINTHAIEPHVGLSVFNFVDAKIGYAVAFRENPVFEGFTLRLAINSFDK